MKTIKTACSLDCWDACSIQVTLSDDDKLIKVVGDKQHSITRGFLCQKGAEHLNRLKSPERITSPMKKVNGQWVKLSWPQAINEISAILRDTVNCYGASSILHYSESGHGGLSKNIDTAFFNSLGKVTVPRGSLCWGAGIAAQKEDFGRVLSHTPEDTLHSKTILIWGRNPVHTNVHLVPFLKEAKVQGANLVVIDPIETATAKMATHYFQIRPESDGALALAMAKIILENEWFDKGFILRFSWGFTEYADRLAELPLEDLIRATGLSPEAVTQLTKLYALHSPASIILGYGLQRYPKGGMNIRYIDALGALTGNIGIQGGGVSYGNKFVSQWIDWDYVENAYSNRQPSFIRAFFSKYILEERKDEIKLMFITKGNPLLQLPNTNQTIEAFKAIPVKVTIDLFMTDTAQYSDYVLPCSHIFEEEDFLCSSMWHSHFYYTQRVLPPRHGVKEEFEIFNLLARSLGMKEYLAKYPSKEAYLKRALAPLLNNSGLTLAELQGKSFKFEGNEIPWENRIFATTTGKFHFAIPSWVKGNRNEDYPLQLLSLHPKHSLHSQHNVHLKEGFLPEVYMSQKTMNTYGIKPKDQVTLESIEGKITAVAALDHGVPEEVIMIYEGWWIKHQAVNRLTSLGVSDLGEQATYNHCFCKISLLR